MFHVAVVSTHCVAQDPGSGLQFSLSVSLPFSMSVPVPLYAGANAGVGAGKCEYVCAHACTCACVRACGRVVVCVSTLISASTSPVCVWAFVRNHQGDGAKHCFRILSAVSRSRLRRSLFKSMNSAGFSFFGVSGSAAGVAGEASTAQNSKTQYKNADLAKMLAKRKIPRWTCPKRHVKAQPKMQLA